MNTLKHIGIKGRGHFCIVKKFLDEKTGNEFALKELKKEHYPKEEYRYRMNREILLLDRLQGCKNIIELIESGHNLKKETLWYLMPFAKMNLYDFIKKNNDKLLKEDRYGFIQQIINALKFAHDKDILHRDISPSNVLVFSKEEETILKLSDFGLGKDSESLSFYTSSSTSDYGQILYVSPEQRLKLKDASIQSDIYSLGKLIYFIFTGKDPDNLKQFELSSLVTKCIEDNPGDRFTNIAELEDHFHSLRDLQLNKKVDIEHLTLLEFAESGSELNWIVLHEMFVKGNYIDHVYHDYISPVNNLLLGKDNLKNYYNEIGNAVKDFVKTYSEKLNECYNTVRWPFSATSTFGLVLKNIITTVNDSETKLICFKELWKLAFVSDQWDVQKIIKKVFNSDYITPEIETQLAEYIIQTETEVDMNHFSTLILPQIIKSSIIKGNKIVNIKVQARKEQQELDNNDFEWK